MGLEALSLPVITTVSPQTQDWFDNNVARAGGPVTRAELEGYLQTWADNNLARPGGPLSNAERILAAKGVGMPLVDVVPPHAAASSRPISPMLLVIGALLLWALAA